MGSVRLTAGLVGARTGLGWSDRALSAYGIEKLLPRRDRVDNLSAWLARDLEQLDANTGKSPLMQLAEVMPDLEALDEGWRQQHDGESFDPSASPLGCFKQRLYEAQAFQDWRDVPPWWKAFDIKQVTAAVQAVLCDPRFTTPVDQPEGDDLFS
jgi:hypothetical protein